MWNDSEYHLFEAYSFADTVRCLLCEYNADNILVQLFWNSIPNQPVQLSIKLLLRHINLKWYIIYRFGGCQVTSFTYVYVKSCENYCVECHYYLWKKRAERKNSVNHSVWPDKYWLVSKSSGFCFVSFHPEVKG